MRNTFCFESGPLESVLEEPFCGSRSGAAEFPLTGCVLIHGGGRPVARSVKAIVRLLPILHILQLVAKVAPAKV